MIATMNIPIDEYTVIKRAEKAIRDGVTAYRLGKPISFSDLPTHQRRKNSLILSLA